MLSVVRCFWEISYDPNVPRPSRQLTPEEGAWGSERLLEKLRSLARSQAEAPGPPQTPAEVLALWLFGNKADSE